MVEIGDCVVCIWVVADWVEIVWTASVIPTSVAEPLLSVKLGILVEDDIFDTLAKEVEGIADVVAGLGAVVAWLGAVVAWLGAVVAWLGAVVARLGAVSTQTISADWRFIQSKICTDFSLK